MALLTNKIGDFEFIALLGEVLPVELQLVADVRPGVSGMQFTRQGVWGEPFELLSQTDDVDWQSARYTFSQYADLVGDDPVNIIQNNYDYSATESILFEVLKVTPRKIRALAGSVGGLNGGGAWLEAVWQLVAVSNFEP